VVPLTRQQHEQLHDTAGESRRYLLIGIADQGRNSHADKLGNDKRRCKGSQTRDREERVKRDGLFAWEGTGMVKGKIS